MNETNAKNDKIDGVLTTFFQKEMPQPWPRWNGPESLGAPRRRSYRLSLNRLVVAASVGVLLLAYLALAGFFPREVSERFDTDRSRDIGRRPVVTAPP